MEGKYVAALILFSIGLAIMVLAAANVADLRYSDASDSIKAYGVFFGVMGGFVGFTLAAHHFRTVFGPVYHLLNPTQDNAAGGAAGGVGASRRRAHGHSIGAGRYGSSDSQGTVLYRAPVTLGGPSVQSMRSRRRSSSAERK